MLAYLAHRPAIAERRSSPNSLLVVIAAHVAAVAIVMSIRMDLPTKIRDLPTRIQFLPEPPAPPEPARPRNLQAQPQPRPDFTSADPIVPMPNDSVTPTANNPLPLPPLPLGPMGGAGSGSSAQPIPATPAVLLTGLAELKPPYPSSKLASGEEALLKLRLTIDADGRVMSVEPLGRADRAFLNAARRHILAHWRYRPASRDGEDVMTSLVVTLRFELNE